MRRAARPAPAPGVIGEVPACLHQRGAPGVWGDDGLAGPRWATAADRWRAGASSAGLSAARVWELLPDGAHRFIRTSGADESDLAGQARALYTDLFTASWSPTAPVPEAAWHLATRT